MSVDFALLSFSTVIFINCIILSFLQKSEVVSFCVHCSIPWDRYQAQAKCTVCSMEVLLCKACQRMKPAPKKDELFCPLCKNKPVVHRAKVKGKSGGGVRDDFG